jgi:hypothetical protein
MVKLKSAGLIKDQIDFGRTKIVRLASQPLGGGTYRQIHHITFVAQSGTTIEVITSNLASENECSEGDVEVFVIAKRLG